MAAGEETSATRRRRRRREEGGPVSLSRTLSYILRHGARAEGLQMGPDGFVDLHALLSLPLLSGVSEQDILGVVQGDPKFRFSLRTEPPGIRANQGHSLPVPLLALTPLCSPDSLPPALAHGTRRGRLGPILAGGLSRARRNHIHLAPGLPGDPAVRSGMRADSEIAIFIDGPRALEDGIPFFLSANGVILTPGDAGGRLPPKYFLRVLQLRPHRCLLPLDKTPENDPKTANEQP